MSYDNTPQVSGSYEDGSFKRPVQSGQPRILVVGSGTSGLTDERYDVTSSGQAETEFGASSELARGMHEALAQGSDNVSLMRIGGKVGTFVATDSDTQTLTITTQYRDAEILERYALIMETVDSANRILVYDLIDQEWVYDSSEILVINEGVVDVDDTGIDLFTIGDVTNPDAAVALASIVIADFTAGGTATMTTVTPTAGADGTSMSLVERYAALNRAYHNLDFQDADYVVPKGVFIDDDNVADGDSVNFFKGVPVAGETGDALGYVWQYEHQGVLYTYFVDSATYFTTARAAATATVSGDIVLTAAKTGTGGNSISIVASIVGAAGPTVTISEPAWNSLLISVVDNGTATTLATVTAINTALTAFTMANGKLASTLVTASGGSVALLTAVASTPLATGTGGHVLTHTDLTGDAIPAAVSAAFTAADTANADSQLREVNFAHQLASFCYTASTTWKAMQGSISVKAPTGYSRADLASWVGSPPVETTKGLDICIDATADNGSGLFGIKLMAGKAITSDGYRAHMIEDGDTTDGYLYGGLIATQGLSLPNGTVDLAYGIDDSDELLDDGGKPVDIGKHIYVTVDWPIHRNAFNGGTSYRGSIEIALVGRLATMPDNEEPIGRQYPLQKITGVPRIHASQKDALSKFRFVNLRLEPGSGWVFNTVRTAAHKLDSDFTRSSTIRCANRELEGIRNIAKRYIGKPFNSTRLAALQADIDGFLVAERKRQIHDGARATLFYTKSDRILGKLTIRLKMVPPFTIEAIDVEMSLAAEESELA